MSFLLYVVGFVVLIALFGWLATLAGISQAFVLGGAALLLAIIGLVTAIARSRRVRSPA